MFLRHATFFTLSLLTLRLAATPVIDDSPTRVERVFDPDLREIGTLRPKAVGQVSASRWTLDCAGLDREHADWAAIREYVAPLGIARIRQQAGWARCEKDPGKYDFAWLDRVVFDAKRMGVDVWMELSYGNPAYPGGGGRQLADGFPTSEEGLAAWDRWVEKMALHYKGVVRDWCVWNEPDIRFERSGNTPEGMAALAVRTAEIIKRHIPDASIAAAAFSGPAWPTFEKFVPALAKSGKADLFTSIVYHYYCRNPQAGWQRDQLRRVRALVREHLPHLKLWEGEGGTQSEWCGTGALCRQPWTERTQAKYDLRRALGDFANGDDTSVFHICDLDYRTSGFHDGLLRYGLVKTTGQADGFRVLKVKTAYYAIQNAVSVFNDALVCHAGQTTSTLTGLKAPLVCDWADRRSNLPVVLFWDAEAEPKDVYAPVSAKLTIKAPPFAEPVWVDVLSGRAFRLPPEAVHATDGATIYDVPAYDSPVFVTDRSLLDLEPSWFARNQVEGEQGK